MKLVASGLAGTMESSDICIDVRPSDDNQIHIYLKSPVEKQYGAHIRSIIQTVLERQGVASVVVSAVDRGALDCTIIARTETALQRAIEKGRASGGDNHEQTA